MNATFLCNDYFCMVKKTSLAYSLANSVSGGTEFGGTASNKNRICWGASGQNGFCVNSVNGLAGSNFAASETDILGCFLVSSFDRKTSQLAKQELMVIFDQIRFSVRGIHGGDL